jgi:NAD(P)-dependent dehydrogenase (short-subunit alcohol dehydrogenase family)
MKNVLITGANKGIGFEVAKQMAEKGYFVYVGCRNENNGNDAIRKLHELGLLHCEFLKIDVSDALSVKQAAETVAAKTEALDVLINNAGIPGGQPQKVSTCDISMMKEVFNTNYFGAVQTTQVFLPLLKKSAQAVIVNVSSELGSLAMQTNVVRNPNYDLYHAYGASKTALNTFTILLAQELKDTQIKVNSVTPGYTATDLNNFAGFKTAAQGAQPIVRLATIGKDGPSGKFFREEGEVSW